MYCEYISDFYIKNNQDFLMFSNLLLGIFPKVGTSGATVFCPPPGSTCSDRHPSPGSTCSDRPENNFQSSVLSPSPLHRGSPVKELIAIDKFISGILKNWLAEKEGC